MNKIVTMSESKTVTAHGIFNNNVMCEKKGENTQKYIWSDVLIATKDEQGCKFALTDDINTPIRFFFYNGVISLAYDYDEFGNIQCGEWNDRQIFGFTGYQKEEFDSKYFGQAREYHATEGRFVNEDIFGGMLSIPTALNRYIYCYQNPLIFWDPLGYFTLIEGIDAHRQLEKIVRETYPGRVETEYYVTGYQYSLTGVGIIDIYFKEYGGQAGEVYELKPISQYGRENLYYPGGVRQRMGYIQALDKKGENVSEAATMFNPNGWTVPSTLYPNKEIRYYTFYDRPGMIYWGFVNKPNPEPEFSFVDRPIVDIRELEKDKSEGQGIIEVILGFLMWCTQNSVPVFGTANCPY